MEADQVPPPAPVPQQQRDIREPIAVKVSYASERYGGRRFPCGLVVFLRIIDQIRLKVDGTGYAEPGEVPVHRPPNAARESDRSVSALAHHLHRAAHTRAAFSRPHGGRTWQQEYRGENASPHAGSPPTHWSSPSSRWSRPEREKTHLPLKARPGRPSPTGPRAQLGSFPIASERTQSPVCSM